MNKNLGKFLQRAAATVIQQSGVLMTIVRYSDNPDGGAKLRSEHTAWCKSQTLTPTFAHNIKGEPASENINENDQRDFVFAGDADIQDRDLIIHDGHYWEVTTSQEQPHGATDTTVHCLCHKRNKVEA